MLTYLMNVLASAAAVRAATLKPQMGWNSWNVFGNDVNESLIQSTANAIAHDGFKAAGYEFVLIDAGWQASTRNSNGQQQANSTKFPSGIPNVAEYVHKLGLKIGIYSDAGIYDCSFAPGSFGYEEVDAKTYADWGIDYLKYDNCGGFIADSIAPAERFQRMAYALNSTGRDIFYSLCQWGNQFPWFWADQICDSYRISGDIHAEFEEDNDGVCKTAYCLNTGYAGVSVLTMIRKMRELSRFQKPGAWGDMDMLEIGTGALSELQEQTHFSFWAALKSPLIFGADLQKINETSRNILLNKEIIAISQDEAGVAVNYLPDISIENQVQIWAGPLRSGQSRLVILALNNNPNATDVDIPSSSIMQLLDGHHSSYMVRDIWAKRDLGHLSTFGTSITLRNVASQQTKVLVISAS